MAKPWERDPIYSEEPKQAPAGVPMPKAASSKPWENDEVVNSGPAVPQGSGAVQRYFDPGPTIGGVPLNLQNLPAFGPIFGAMGLGPKMVEVGPDPRARYDAALKAVRQSQFANMSDEQWAAYSAKAFAPYDATALSQHGALYGGTDELSSAIGAVGSQARQWTGGGGAGFGEAWQLYEELEQARRDLGRQQHATLGTIAEMAGGIASLKPVVSPAANASPIWQGFKGAVGAGAQGGAYGFGATDGDVGQRAAGAGVGAGVGLGAGFAGPLVVRGVQSMASRGAQTAAIRKAPSAASLKTSAQGLYKARNATDAVIARSALNALKTRVRTLAQDEGLILPSGHLAGGFPKLRKAVKAVGEWSRGSLGIKEAATLHRSIRRAANSADPEEKRIGLLLLNEFESFLDSLPMSAFKRGNGVEAVRLWTNARSEWARFKRTDTVEQAIERARFARDGFAEGLRYEFAQIVKSPKKRMGFTDAELDILRQVAEGAPIEAFLRFLQRGGPLPAYLLGHVSAGPVAGAAVAGGKMLGNMGIKAFSDRAAREAANRIRAHIATPGGLPNSIPRRNPALERFARGAAGRGGNVLLDHQRQALARQFASGGR